MITKDGIKLALIGLPAGIVLDILIGSLYNGNNDIAVLVFIAFAMLAILAKIEIDDQVEKEMAKWEAKFKYKKGDV
jgi:hypothetical protein